MPGSGDFDYIIVGAGSAGCVLANRLGEDPGVRILVLEAGGSEKSVIVDMPAALSIPMNTARFNWGMKTEPEPGLAGREVNLPRGKGLGGSSSINGMCWVRGNPMDYELWEALGATGWRWSNVLPYFQRLEGVQGGGPLRGTDGPVEVRRGPESNPLYQAFVEAGVQAGYARSANMNEVQHEGFGPMEMNVGDGLRMSAARAYLRPAMARGNVRVITGALVEHVAFEGRRATHVVFNARGRQRKVKAKREVVLSAGSIMSPMILKRSGVGPAAELKQHGIAVIHDAPQVGENLMDHPHISCGVHLKPAGRLPPHQRRHIYFALRYSSGLADCTPGDMFMMPVNRAGWHPLGKRMGSLVFCVNKSYSRGQVRLSKDPRAEPFVDINMLSDGRDLRRLVGAYKLLYRIMESPDVKAMTNFWFLAGYSDAVRKISIKKASNWMQTAAAAAIFGASKASREWLARQRFGDLDRIHKIVKDDDAIADWIKSSVYSGWHVSGSCRMGPDGDKMAVLDARCRVRGIDGLSVVDASAMPTAVSANTNISTIAIAERVAELTRESG